VDPARQQPLRVLIVDDEPLARDLLRHLLGDLEVTVVGECSDGLQAIEAIRRLAPELVFLDIEMPGLDGFDVVEAIGPAAMPPVVFVTAHEQHALRAFQCNALDYVLKPISAPRFAESFRRARARLRTLEPATLEVALRALLASREREHHRRRFLVRRGDKLVVVDAGDVELIEAAGNYVRLECGERAFLFRGTIAGLAEELDPAQFLRIHRGFIVRVDRVRSLARAGAGELTATVAGGRSLPVQRRYADALRLALGA
jgi:two-component system LytT family response regulator